MQFKATTATEQNLISHDQNVLCVLSSLWDEYLHNMTLIYNI